MDVKEITGLIAETAIAGLGELVEEAVLLWSGGNSAWADMYGNIWLDGDRMSDERILEFWAWNEADKDTKGLDNV